MSGKGYDLMANAEGADAAPKKRASFTGGGGSTDAPALKTRNSAAWNEKELREQEADAERRIAAALGGKCSFVSLPDGSMNMRVTYKIGPRKEKEEDVQDIPRPLLKVRVYARCILPQISFLLVLE